MENVECGDRDKAYAKIRNSFLDAAEKFANHRYGVSCKGTAEERGKWARKWSKCFMNRVEYLYQQEVKKREAYK